MSLETTRPIATNLTTGNTPWITYPFNGVAVMSIGGVFGGATIQLEARLKEFPAIVTPLLDTVNSPQQLKSSNSPTSFSIELTTSHEIRITSTGGGGSQSISAYIVNPK